MIYNQGIIMNISHLVHQRTTQCFERGRIYSYCSVSREFIGYIRSFETRLNENEMVSENGIYQNQKEEMGNSNGVRVNNDRVES